ncbi:hypothetical protein OROMI_012439 [Orobanche minor]
MLYDCMHYVVVKVLGRVSCYYPFVQHEIDDSYPSDIKGTTIPTSLLSYPYIAMSFRVMRVLVSQHIGKCTRSWQGYNTGRELTSPDDTKGLESFNL